MTLFQAPLSIAFFIIETLFGACSLLAQLYMPVVLYVLGYNTRIPNLSDRFRKAPRSILIFSHTSYWDFFFFILYYFAEPDFGQRVRVVMSAYYYRLCPWLLSRFGVIPAPSHSQQVASNRERVGFVQATSEALRKQSQFILMISPEGTILSAPWKSGYYALAKELQCPIIVGGLDYEKKSIYLSEPYDCIDADSVDESTHGYAMLPRDKVEPYLQEEMEVIVGLYPECSFTTCHPMSSVDITLINIPHLIKILSLVSIMYHLCRLTDAGQYLIYTIIILSTYEFIRLIRLHARPMQCMDLGLAFCYALAATSVSFV